MPKKQSTTVAIRTPPGLTPEQARKVMMLADVEREEVEQRKGRFALGGQLLAAGVNSAGGLFGALDMALTAGAMSVAGGAIEAVQAIFLRDGMERLRATGREPDLSATGIGLAAACAEQGARVDAVVRELWMRMLTRCIDPAYRGRVRLSDIELVKTLNSSDALLLLVLGKYRETVRQEWVRHELSQICQGTGLWQAQSNAQDGVATMIPLELIRRHAATVLGAPVQVPIAELAHALDVRSIHRPKTEAVESPALFQTGRREAWVNLFEYDDQDVRARLQTNIMRNGAYLSPSKHDERALLEALTDVTVTPPAMRVVELLVDDRSGY